MSGRPLPPAAPACGPCLPSPGQAHVHALLVAVETAGDADADHRADPFRQAKGPGDRNGAFGGSGHEEVGGVFEKHDLVGAFGAIRQPSN